jgi:hypothetical protein
MIALPVAGGRVATNIAVLVSKRQRNGQELDLGAVSNQWVAEHRLGQTHDTQH